MQVPILERFRQWIAIPADNQDARVQLATLEQPEQVR